MIKAFLLAALVAVASAECVHQFRAESYFMCAKCEQAVNYISANGNARNFDMCKDKQGFDYTTICAKVEAHIPEVHQMLFDGKKSDEICEELGMCGNVESSEWLSKDAINEDLISEINSDPNGLWKAETPQRFKGLTLGDVRKQLGTIVDSDHTYRLPVKKYSKEEILKANLPTDFDSREQWTSCSDVIGHIRDQSSCGCCWAFGSTEAYNDRLCISQNTFQQLLSVEDTCACCNFVACDSMGCNGGQPTLAWEWFASTGVVSGGDYDDIGKNDTCDPFTLPPCAHHVNSTEYPACPSSEYPTPECKKECSNTAYPKDFKEDTHYAAKAYSLRSVDDIMNDLYSYGTVTAAFTVYEDFLSYKSGVYVHKSGSALGGHAIKIFGWGVDDGTDYWWCANSWNDSWGDNGFFKIKKGVNECGIEDDVSAGNA